MSTAPANSVGDAWADARRLEGWAGEARVNLVRVAAILAFYAHHLLNVYVFRDDPTVVGPFHVATTTLTVAWAISNTLFFAERYQMCHGSPCGWGPISRGKQKIKDSRAPLTSFSAP